MTARVRVIEFVGGPWDGAAVPVSDDQHVAAITDGLTVHLYERGESYEGPRVREVFRQSRVLPLPRRESRNHR